jgi:hypothetical protein
VIDAPLTRYRPADNPFASHRVKMNVYWDYDVDAEHLLRRLDQLGGRGAIVGPKGSGKTTLLEDLSFDIDGRVKWVRIPGSEPHPLKTALEQLDHSVTPSDSVLIDGSEQLGTIGWQRFLLATLRAGRLVATLHRPGRLPTLFECTPNPDILISLVHYLDPDDAVILEPHLPDLFRRHGGNIRLCFRELYDAYAGRRHGR